MRRSKTNRSTKRPARATAVRSKKETGFSELGRRTGAPPISWLMGLTLTRPRLVSLAAGFTDNESLPVEISRELLDAMLSSPTQARAALQYGSTAGDPRLRQLTSEHLLEKDLAAAQAYEGEVRLNPDRELYSLERVLVTNGSQQLLYLLTEALFDPGDILLLEDPTYFVYLGTIQSHGLSCRGIPLQPDGLDLSALESTLETLKRQGALPRVKLLYLVTYHQNPTGVTTVLDKKAAVLEMLRHYERAAGHPIYVVEDAAYRELRFAGEDVVSMLPMRGAADRVIYAGTFSKPFATGIRVGYGVVPEPLRNVLVRLKGNHDFGTANLLQQLMAQALASGWFNEHLMRLQKRYAQKARVMMKSLEEHFPAKIGWQRPEGGLYIWARLPKTKKTGTKSKIFEQALEQEVLYVPGELCYAEDPTRTKPNHEMRLSFGGATEGDIPLGVARLGKVLRWAMINSR